MSREQDLLEIQPQQALERYLKHRSNEVSKSTVKAHEYRLNHFVRWCSGTGIEALSDLQPHHLQDFRYWREDEGDLNLVSVQTQMSTLRVFIKWAEDYGAVSPRLSEHVRVPNPDDESRDDKIDPGRVEDILDYYNKYEYASREHTLFSLLWHTGMRIGTARALDVDDFLPNDEKHPHLKIEHRPDTDTPLKNKTNGERRVALDDIRVTLLEDHIGARRFDVTDDHGRQPLFTTESGRAAKTTLREWIYRLARPCTYKDGFCPHGREMSDCAAATRTDDASKCPSSFSPHTIRRSAITYWLLQRDENESMENISQRMNVNRGVIEAHYDERTQREKMAQRVDFFS